MPIHVIKVIKGGYANTYLMENDGSFVAVDVGTSRAARRIYHYFSDRSIDASSLRMVIATHFHMDHVAGISKLLSFFPGTRVCFSAMVKNYLNRKDKIHLFSIIRWIRGLLPTIIREGNHCKNIVAALLSDKIAIPLPFLRKFSSYEYIPECILSEGQSIPYLPHWELIETPGHTPDSICFYNRKEQILISGDTILNMKGKGGLNNFCCDCDAIKKSLKKLLSFKIQTIYPGHGKFLCNLNNLEEVTQ